MEFLPVFGLAISAGYWVFTKIKEKLEDPHEKMLTAADEGDTAEMMRQVGAGVPVGMPNKAGQTALHLAALHGRVGAVRALLAASANPLARDKDSGASPLHYAAQKGHVDVVNLLLRAMERPFNMPNKEGRTAAQADPTANLVPQDNENLTPLNCAAAEGHVDVVKALLLAASAAATMATTKGQTALHLAAFHGHAGVVEALLAGDANPLALDNENWTPLHYATQQGHVHLVNALLRAAPAALTIATASGIAPIHLAAQWDHCDVVLALLSAGTPVGLPDNLEAGSPLHHAAKDGSTGVIAMLVEHQAAIEAVDRRGRTALHWTARDEEDSSSHAAAVALLLRLGADPHACDQDGKRAVDLASGKPNVRQALLAAH